MNVICISGKARHGKDTVANMMKESIEQAGEKVLIIHYADLLKFICTTYYGWDGVKNDYGRQLLQDVGTGIARKRNQDYWVNTVSDFLTLFQDEWNWAIIPDTRFPNEVSMVYEKFGGTHVRVERGKYDGGLTDEQLNHPSETMLDDYFPDYYIKNHGSLEQLRETVNTCLKEIIYAGKEP